MDELFMDELFYDIPLVSVQFSSTESLKNSIVKNDDLQEFKEYKYKWGGKNKKKVRTFSFGNVKYHMLEDFYKKTPKPTHIPKDIRINRKNNEGCSFRQNLIINVGNVTLHIKIEDSKLKLKFLMADASYSLEINMNADSELLPKDCEAYFNIANINCCHGITCFIISKPVNHKFSREMTDYFESFIKRNLREIIDFFTAYNETEGKWIEQVLSYYSFDFGLCAVPTKEVLDYEQKYNDTVPKKRKMLGLSPNERERLDNNFYVSDSSRTVGGYNLCGEYHFFETVSLDERDNFYEIPTYVTKIREVCERSPHNLIKKQDFVFSKKAGSKNMLSINFSQHLHKYNQKMRQDFESSLDYWYTHFSPLLYPELLLLQVNSITLKIYDKKIEIEDNAFRCVQTPVIDLSQVWGLKEINGNKVFNVEIIGKLIVSKDVKISPSAFVVEDMEMINPEFTPEEIAEELIKRKEIKDEKIDYFMKNNIVRV